MKESRYVIRDTCVVYDSSPDDWKLEVNGGGSATVSDRLRKVLKVGDGCLR